jgi:hypothetical protein
MTRRLLPLLAILTISTPAFAQWGSPAPSKESSRQAPPGGWSADSNEAQSAPPAAPPSNPGHGWGKPREQGGKNGEWVPAPTNGPSHGNQKIYVVYAGAKSQFNREMEEGLRKSGGFESLAAGLDSLFAMPRDLPIVMGECGVINMFYDPQGHRIVVCYEYMEHLLNLAKEQHMNFANDNEVGQWVGSVTVFALFHELGHALINELNLPATGREEDAVDEFATLLLSHIGEPGTMASLSAAAWFKVEDQSMQQHGVKNPFWDEHSFNLQRMVTIVCILIGTDQHKFQPLADTLQIPPERVARCMQDYPKKDNAWKQLLKPYMKRAYP